MKNNYLVIKGLITAILLLIMSSSFAQINVSVQVLPPFKYRITDYASHPNQLLVTVTNTSGTAQRLQLRGSVTGDNGISITVRPTSKTRTPVILSPGQVQVLNGNDMINFLDVGNAIFTGITAEEALRQNGLPEGNYTLCIRAYNYDTNVPLSADQPIGCSNTFSITNIEPPQIINPYDGQAVSANAVQTLNLSWSTPPGAPPSVMYRIRIVEVVGNTNPNTAMANAPRLPFFETETSGNMYIYGPTDPQLVIGRKYAMMVQAYDPSQVINFRNNGQSVVTSFTYVTPPTVVATTTPVDAGPVTPPPAVVPPSMPVNSTLKGLVAFAYASSEEANESGLPLAGSTAAAESVTYESLTNATAGITRFALKNAQVTVYGKTEPTGAPFTLGTGTSGTDGSYSISINSATAEKCTDIYMVVAQSDNQLYPVTKTLKLQKTADGYSADLGTTVLPIVSMRVKPFVVSKINYTSGQVTASILLNAAKYNASPLMKAAGLGTSETVIYNNVSYVVLAKLTSGGTYKKLFRSTLADDYLVQVTGTGKPSVYYPLGLLTERRATDTAKVVAVVAKNFVYNPSSNEIEGIVSFAGAPYSGTRITATVTSTDILDNTTVTSFDAVSDATGFYKFSTLPTLKKGAIVNLSVTDRTIQETAMLFTVTTTGAVLLTKNIVLAKGVATIIGRLMISTYVPLPNALVTYGGTNISTRTTADGLYILKVPYPLKKGPTIEFSADGYLDKSTNQFGLDAYPYSPALTNGVYTATQWSKHLNSPSYVQVLKPWTSAVDITADRLGIGTGKLVDAFPKYFSAGEDVKAIYEAANIALTTTPGGDVGLQFLLEKKELVAAKVWVDGVQQQNAVSGQLYIYKGLPGKHTFAVEPSSVDQAFLRVTGEFTIVNTVYGGGITLLVPLHYAMIISGVVRDQKTGKGLDSALVTIQGLPYQVYTDKNGAYQLSLPSNREYTVVVTRPTYEGASDVRTLSSSQTVDFPVKWIDPTYPILKTLSGFPVTISKIDKITEGNFTISGTLTVASNALYGVDAANSKLTFTNINIKAKPTDINAVPIADVSFNEAVMQVKALGFAPVEVQGVPYIKLKAQQGSDYSSGVIGGDKLMLKLSSTVANDNLPVQLPDVAIKDAAVTSPFNYVFSIPGASLAELSNTRVLKLLFGATGYLESKAGAMGSLFIEKNTASVSSTGYKLGGYFRFPDIDGLSYTDTLLKRIKLPDSFLMKPGTGAQTYALPVSDLNPYVATMQSFKMTLTKMELAGVGSANPTFTMAGKVEVLKKGSGSDDNGVLSIKSLTFVKKDAGSTLSAVLKFPQAGLTIQGMNFTTPTNNDELSMSYDFGEKSFQLNAAGTLKYSGTGASTGMMSALKSVFPIAITKLTLNSKDWSMYLVAAPNITVDLKVIKITVNRLLVNIGYGLSMKDMTADLVKPVPKPKPALTPPPGTSTKTTYPQLEASSSSWAVGINGGITIPVDGAKSAAATVSFIVANIDNKIQVSVDSIALELKTAAFQLTSTVGLRFDDDKQGFSAAAKLVMATKEFGASFKYFSLAGGGLQLGASMTVPIQAVTGPIYWYSVGAGFDINTKTQVYSAYLKGDLGPFGVPKKVAYVSAATLGILFDEINCGDNPVITGSGMLIMKEKAWGTMNMTADFCKKFFAVSVKTDNIDVPLVDGVQARVDGVLYALAPQTSSSNGAFFLGINSYIHMGSLVQGDAFVAFGYNFNNSTPNAPADAKTIFSKINAGGLDKTGLLNALYIKGDLNAPYSHATVELNIAGFKAMQFRYYFKSTGSFEMYYKYVENQFYAWSDFHGKSDIRIYILGIEFGAMASNDLTLTGGYSSGNWFVKGAANMGLAFYNQSGLSCNSVTAKFCDAPDICPCFDWWYGIPYPNGKFNCSCGDGWIPCGFGFKVCTNLHAEFDISSSGTNANIYLF